MKSLKKLNSFNNFKIFRDHIKLFSKNSIKTCIVIKLIIYCKMFINILKLCSIILILKLIRYIIWIKIKCSFKKYKLKMCISFLLKIFIVRQFKN